jgi:hypothetical protein
LADAEKLAVAAHGFGGVTAPFFDHSLINSPSRTIRDEAVVESVSALDDFPLKSQRRKSCIKTSDTLLAT